MFGFVDAKVYAFVALITTGLLWLINFLDKGEFVKGFLLGQATRAAGSGFGSAMTNFVVRPLVFAVDNWIGAAIAGVLWPLMIVWLLLLVLLLAFAFIAPGVFTARCSFSVTC
jgi:hypothetical protein